MDTSELYIKTPEHREKLSIAMRGNRNQEKVRSLKTRARIANSMKGNGNTRGYLHDATMRLRCSLGKLAEKNPAWIGGRSYRPYTAEWTRELKQRIKDRDKQTCQLCIIQIEDVRELYVHHIDYDKSNNSEDNLITLCHSCHSKTNHHRTEWGIHNGWFSRNENNVRERYEGSPRILCEL
ncbi:hypothetical protein LCGC14_0370190 [marine sediment metagenome]|uniref:HNH nuclease domain-containing protein n=1 Tax=marine sediment metagenome TaxID=412755 RepID=A0A0F9T5K1_9ZZZZ